MKFEFGKATDITEFSKLHFNEMYEGYEKIYITPDSKDYHILRILKGYGEDYDISEDSFILEYNHISNEGDRSGITGINKLKRILAEDDGCYWPYVVKSSLGECIEIVDGGYGIN